METDDQKGKEEQQKIRGGRNALKAVDMTEESEMGGAVHHRSVQKLILFPV